MSDIELKNLKTEIENLKKNLDNLIGSEKQIAIDTIKEKEEQLRLATAPKKTVHSVIGTDYVANKKRPKATTATMGAGFTIHS